MVWLLMMAMGGSPVLGDWKTKGGAVVRAYECGDAVCIKVVRLSPNPPGTVDGRNPNQSLRTRPICGMDIGTGFKPGDPMHWNGGRVYDPLAGKTYKSNMTLEGDTLKLRGYVGVSALGRTETWARVDTIEACKP